MSVLSRRSPKPLNLVSFGDDGRAVIDVPVASGGGGDGSSSAAISASAAANHAALREAASLGGVDPDDLTPFWRRRPTRWGMPQKFQATQAFFAFACALGVLGALTDKRNASGLALTHALTKPLPWSAATADSMPRILVTTELPQRVLVTRTLALMSFSVGLLANAAPLVTHRVRSWCYECLVQKTTPARALDLAFALGVSAAMLTAHTGVRDAGTVAAAAACAWAFAACVLAAQHSLFYACMLSAYGARLKSRSEIGVSLLAALAVATAGCVPAAARAALSATAPGDSDSNASLAAAALFLSYTTTALVSAAHTCELLGDGAADAALGSIALAVRIFTFLVAPTKFATVLETIPPAPPTSPAL
jgi:hypothetical protein